MDETSLLRLALVAYALAWAVQALRPRTAPTIGSSTTGATPLAPGLGLTLLITGLALHTVSLAARWTTLGHGPFTTMHEILSSNLWSLTLVLALAAVIVREVRAAWLAAAPVLLVLALWLLMADSRAGHLPPTYDTILLYLHTLVGKLFLGLLLVAVALSAVPWLRGTLIGARLMRDAPADVRCDELAHRFAAFAFVFDTLMLIVGAVWAQDAWGRWWAWDPLETWAFLTWLALAASLHARATIRPSPRVFGAWLACVFVIAFLTFFGVPFLSTSPHKGAV